MDCGKDNSARVERARCSFIVAFVVSFVAKLFVCVIIIFIAVVCRSEGEKLCAPTPIPWARVRHRTSQEVVYECDDGYVTADGDRQFSILCHSEVTVKCGKQCIIYIT